MIKPFTLHERIDLDPTQDLTMFGGSTSFGVNSRGDKTTFGGDERSSESFLGNDRSVSEDTFARKDTPADTFARDTMLSGT
jgi:hypothetical protein